MLRKIILSVVTMKILFESQRLLGKLFVVVLHEMQGKIVFM
jgi:hypothetical protein